jgi:addiction module RelB/DinJ family antitoxin
MSKEADIRGKVTPELKEQFKAILAEIGLTPSVAIGMFARQVVQCHGLPFRPQILNPQLSPETLAAMADVENKQDLITHNSVEDMFQSWDKELN